MNSTLVLLTLALVAGLALAPTAAASCPPSGHFFACMPVTPLGDYVGCMIDGAGDMVAEAAADCL